ncbi:MAG: hypothetical protein WC458_00405 [Patescibacteria group bacterium]|jgi:hypothetical protein
MDINDFDQKLVAKIKEAGIAPKPRWHFLLKKYVVWISGALALAFGAASVSVMIYLLKFSGWEIREQTHKSLGEFFLLTLPYFWLIFLGLFIFILYYNLKHVKNSYRYPVWFIAVGAVLASVILGSFLFLAGWGEKIDNVLGERAPLYDKVINRQMDFWFNPAEGRLVGLVIAQENNGIFYILDSHGDDWRVLTKMKNFPLDRPEVGQPVNLIGRVLEGKEFEAEIVRPVRPGREFFGRPGVRRNEFNCPAPDCRPPLFLAPGDSRMFNNE